MEAPKSNLLAVSVVVTDSDGRVLLDRRDKEPDAGKWQLFASYPRLDELPLTNAAERILREAGIHEVESITFSGKFYDAPDRHPGKYCVPLVFIARVREAPVTLTQRWFTRDELKDLPLALDNEQTLTDLGFRD